LVVPVYEGGKRYGFVFAGGFLEKSPTADEEAEITKKSLPYHGTKITDEKAALREIPVLSENQIQSLRDVIEFGIEEVRRYHHERIARHAEIIDSSILRTRNDPFRAIVGQSVAMQELYSLLDKLRDSESTVLIQGENGTGKEMVAKAIYANSLRCNRAFVTQNCSALNDNLLDSELFGHIRGSFTGAIRDKKGLFEVADGATLFMDEVGDMSRVLQVKVLRVLQEGMFVPVGGIETKHVDVRIIAATNKDLRQMVEEGTFREDLFYRINVINLRVPSLRERREDIPSLVDHFLRRYSKSSKDIQKRFSPLALDALMAFNWPGNVRQLENEVQRATVLSGKSPTIDVSTLSPSVTQAAAGTIQVKAQGKLRVAMEHVERQILLDGLRRSRWNKSKLSRELGISRATLIWKIQKYGLVEGPRT